jgi:predicted nucleic acid-binding protein
MIVLDTNVLSEALKPLPNPMVLRWLAAQEREAVFITAITHAEVLYGVEMFPPGSGRSRLASAIEKLFADEFRGRIIPFDEDAARMLPKVVAHRQKRGRPISQFDAMIASICRCHGAAVATRNVNAFEHCGVSVIDPWNESST